MHNLRFRKNQWRSIRTKKAYSVYVWAFLFLFWTFSTNPQAALFLGDRIWLLTLVQLFLLTWLAGELFDTPEKHRLLMGAIVLATLGSAIVAIQESSIGESFSTSARATGLAGGANTTVRLFVFALIMLTFLLRSLKTRSAQLFGIGGIVILTIGVVATVSRTGFLMLAVALAMIFWDELTTRIRPGILFAFLATFVVIVLWIPDSYWLFMFQDASRSILDGTDTIGLRYRLWRVAWQMWQDHPLAGVGIGQFGELSQSYGLITGYHNLGAHSIYFALLAETGIVGLALYAGLMISALVQLFHVARSNQGEWSGLARTWLFLLVLVLIGGITKHDQYDKFPWLIPGLAIAISSACQQEEREKK